MTSSPSVRAEHERRRELCKTVRPAREAKGLSLHAVARAAGVEASTVLRIERGEQLASPATLRATLAAIASLEGEELELVRLGIERGSFEHLRDVLRFEDDACVRYAVAAHPEGLSVEQVCDVLHLGVTAVQEAYYSALEKLRAAAGTNTPEGDELEWLRERLLEQLEAREQHESVWDFMSPEEGAAIRHVVWEHPGLLADDRSIEVKPKSPDAHPWRRFRRGRDPGPPTLGSFRRGAGMRVSGSRGNPDITQKKVMKTEPEV